MSSNFIQDFCIAVGQRIKDKCLYQPFFLETSVRIFSDDDVVEDINADDPAGVDEPPGDAQVFFRRLRVAGRVVMDEDHR